MELHYVTPQLSSISQNQSGHEFEEKMGDDFDPFYADIRKQILLLMSDDDEEEFAKKSCSSSSPEGLNKYISSIIAKPGGETESFFSSWQPQNSGSAPPNWSANSLRNGNGTGVFIPQIVKSRRRYRPGKNNKETRRKYKQVQT